nr:hypothetical protein HK105_007823 [Polyrhizophydium stewartii]
MTEAFGFTAEAATMSRTPVKAHGFAPRQSSPLARRAAWGGDGASEDEPVSPWRQVFKERCMDRIRQSRADVVRSRRFGLAAQSPAQGATALVAAGAVAGGSPEGAAVPQHQQPFRFRPMLGEEIMASRRRSAVRPDIC